MAASSIDDSAITFAHARHIGASGSRKTLEDYAEATPVRLADDTLVYVGMVADGMGGIEAGEIASRTAVEAAIDHLRQTTQHAIVQGMRDALENAQVQVLAKRRELGINRMGTTATLVAVTPDYRMFLAHVGDSRAYIIRGRDIYQVTLDHSWGEEQVRAGRLTEEEAATHERSEALNRYIGQPRELEVDTGVWLKQGAETLAEAQLNQGFQLMAGDSVVVCSDGLIKQRINSEDHFVEPYEIVQIINNSTPNEAVKDLIERALKRQVDDNVSVVVLHLPKVPRFLEETKPPSAEVVDTLVDTPEESDRDTTKVPQGTAPLTKRTVAERAQQPLSRPEMVPPTTATSSDDPGGTGARQSGRINTRLYTAFAMISIASAAVLVVAFALITTLTRGAVPSATIQQGTADVRKDGQLNTYGAGRVIRLNEPATIDVGAEAVAVLVLPEENVRLYIGGPDSTSISLTPVEGSDDGPTLEVLLLAGRMLVESISQDADGSFTIYTFGSVPLARMHGTAMGLQRINSEQELHCLGATSCLLLDPVEQPFTACTYARIVQEEVSGGDLINSDWTLLAPEMPPSALCNPDS